MPITQLHLLISKTWLSLPLAFELAQKFFNGDFWLIFQKKFGEYGKGNVLDLACGTGTLRNYLLPKTYLGIDLNRFYITRAKMIFAGKENVDFLLGDITKSVPKGDYDAVFLIGIFHHLQDKQIRKLCYLLKQNFPKTVIILDGIQQPPFKPLLRWLDTILGGGKYFRTKEDVINLVSNYFRVKKSGIFRSNRPFYKYMYIIGIS